MPRTFKRNHYFILESPFVITEGFVIAKEILMDGRYRANGIFKKGDILFPKVQDIHLEFKALSDVSIELSDDWENTTETLLTVIKFQQITRHQRSLDKLQQLLIYFCDNFSTDNGFLNFRISHDDVAEMLDCTRCTVTRGLKRIEGEGYINSKGSVLEFTEKFTTLLEGFAI
jgi:hypothetical protein